MVESQPSKLLVAGSIPVSRSIHFRAPWVKRRAMVDAHRSVTREGGQPLTLANMRVSYGWQATRRWATRLTLANVRVSQGWPAMRRLRQSFLQLDATGLSAEVVNDRADLSALAQSAEDDVSGRSAERGRRLVGP